MVNTLENRLGEGCASLPISETNDSSVTHIGTFHYDSKPELNGCSVNEYTSDKYTDPKASTSFIVGKLNPELKVFHVYPGNIDPDKSIIDGFDNKHYPKMHIGCIGIELWKAGISRANFEVMQIGDKYGLKVTLFPNGESPETYNSKVVSLLRKIAH